MYKLLLCVRYLRTRFLAMICIASVMLGVATLIVVNSVMSGFSVKLRQNLHNMIADVVVESAGLEGFSDPDEKMRRIKEDPYLGPRVEAMAATVECFAVMQYTVAVNGQVYSRPVRLLGIDPKMRKDLGGFDEYLMDFAKNKSERANAFSLPPLIEKAWRDYDARLLDLQRREEGLPAPAPIQVHEELPINPPVPVDQAPQAGDLPPPAPPIAADQIEPPHGIVVGKLIAGFPDHEIDPKTGKPSLEPKMVYTLKPDDSVILLTVKSGGRAEPTYDRFVVVDYFESKMSEYDNMFVFVELKHLQKLRGSDNSVTSIQIKLTEYRDTKEITDRLKAMFPFTGVRTWEEKQGPLLAAIDIERAVLNVLLFLIVGVAGFSILAIFTMIVAEKTRDIGIMKSLGASNRGVLQIFLSYGLLLGVVGSVLGTVVGLLFTVKINTIENWLSTLTGQHVFDPRIYYFNEIPTNIETLTVILVNIGAILIAVTFSVLPALRAAMLHPVRALRFE